jgi:hypothetical protein
MAGQWTNSNDWLPATDQSGADEEAPTRAEHVRSEIVLAATGQALWSKLAGKQPDLRETTARKLAESNIGSYWKSIISSTMLKYELVKIAGWHA